jgi:hypothetical protein
MNANMRPLGRYSWFESMRGSLFRETGFDLPSPVKDAKRRQMIRFSLRVQR